MAQAIMKTDAEQVSEHISGLVESVRDTVQCVQEAILSAFPLVSERIKWNSPSFYCNGKLDHEDPKVFPREMAVFTLFKNRMMLLFPQTHHFQGPRRCQSPEEGLANAREYLDLRRERLNTRS